MPKKYKDILWERKGAVVWITLNRPGQRNALSVALAVELREAFEDLRWEDSVKVVVLTGSGEKAFCAGLDLKERSRMSPEEILVSREREVIPLFHRLGEFPKPIVGAINGVALGGGAELALVCDVRIASPQARFGQTEIRWGMIPSAGGCQRLRVLAGVGAAKELILTGRVIEAEAAHRLGIYNRIVPLEDLVAAATALAEEMAQHSLIALKQAKRALDFGTGVGPLQAFDLEASKECFYRGEALEGHKSFNPEG